MISIWLVARIRVGEIAAHPADFAELLTVVASECFEVSFIECLVVPFSQIHIGVGVKRRAIGQLLKYIID